MTVVLDFDWRDPDFLLPSQGVRAAGVSEPRSGCTADTLNVRASVVRGTTKVTRAASLTVVVEKSSDDGDSWTTAHTFTFSDSGIQDAEIASTPDLLRVRWTPSGGSWSSLQLEASPAAAADGGGGSLPLLSRTTAITSAQLLNSFTVPVVVLPDPGAGVVVLPWSLSCVSHAGSANYTLAGGSALTGGSGFNVTLTGVSGLLGSFPPLVSYDFCPPFLSAAFDPSSHADVTLFSAGGDPTDGDYAITATLLYLLLTL